MLSEACSEMQTTCVEHNATCQMIVCEQCSSLLAQVIAWCSFTRAPSTVGEVPWVMRNIKAYHSEAVKKNVKIVHFCGFDSIPSDLGTAVMVDHMQSKLNR